MEGEAKGRSYSKAHLSLVLEGCKEAEKGIKLSPKVILCNLAPCSQNLLECNPPSPKHWLK